MKCYHCGISFDHEGDPIDGNDFCSHICSGDYIQNIQRLSMATGRPPSQVARMHRYILKNFEKEEKEQAELRELRSTVPGHHKYTDEEIRQIRRCDEHYYNLPLGMKSDAHRQKPDPRVPETEMERVSRKTRELYHTDPVIKDVVDMEIERNKVRKKEEEP